MKALSILLTFGLGLASAAPQLRLSNAAIVVVATVGMAVPAQTIDAINQGDGALSLSVAVQPPANWVTASLASPTTIRLAFNTASLGRGNYTAQVLVSDPHAIDAPQSITVTAQIGTTPASVDEYMAPGTNRQFPIEFADGADGAYVQGTSTWLSVILYGASTLKAFRFYSINLSPPADMAPGNYSGVVTNGLPSDTIPVTMHVTTQPIAQPSTTRLDLRVAQGGPVSTDPFLPAITLTNAGMGTLLVNSASSTDVGVQAQADSAGRVVLTADPGSLTPGTYTGPVTIQCNAANCPLQVPVNLTIVAPTVPVIAYQGVVDNATFLPAIPVAPGDVTLVKGEQLSMQAPAFAPSVPLPTKLGGARVLVDGEAAPLYYSSAGQIAFQMPWATPAGTSLVQVERDGQLGNTVTVNITPRAPRIVAVTDTSYTRIDANHPVKAGDTIILWGIGMGPTSTAVRDGEPSPSDPPALLSDSLTAIFYNGVTLYATPTFAGLSPGSVGLYQVMVKVPADHPKGPALLTLQYPQQFPAVIANSVSFVVQ